MSHDQYDISLTLHDNQLSVDFLISEEEYVIAEGHVKWDGCWNFTIGPEIYWHGCSLSDLDHLTATLKEVYRHSIVMMGDKVLDSVLSEIEDYSPPIKP